MSVTDATLYRRHSPPPRPLRPPSGTSTVGGRRAAHAFLDRLKERTDDRPGGPPPSRGSRTRFPGTGDQ